MVKRPWLLFLFIRTLPSSSSGPRFVILSNSLLLLRSHSHNDVLPEPQRNISMAAVRGAVRLSIVQ